MPASSPPQYLKTPASKDTLRELVSATGQTVRALLREKDTPYAELGLSDPKWADEQLLDFIVQHPILMNRPIVVTPLQPPPCVGHFCFAGNCWHALRDARRKA